MLIFMTHLVVFEGHNGRTGKDAERDEVFESRMALDIVRNKLIRINRWILLSLQVEPYHLLLRFYPLDLVTGHQWVSAHLVFQPVEFVDNYSNEEIEDENVADDYERDEVEGHDGPPVEIWLQV